MGEEELNLLVRILVWTLHDTPFMMIQFWPDYLTATGVDSLMLSNTLRSTQGAGSTSHWYDKGWERICQSYFTPYGV